MKIAVIGTGYVGLVTGTCLAETGNEVTCMDNNSEKVASMQRGIMPIYEPHLDVMFNRNVREKRLSFTTSLEEAVREAKVIFLALPTPPGADGSADLSAVLEVAGQLGRLIEEYKVVVDKSTVPVGTAEKVTAEIARHARAEFDVVSNPEFLREGFAVEDFMKPDRVVIGTDSERAREIMERLYKPFVRQGNPILFMDVKSAELTKYAANAFLATKITFMNEIANFCEKVGADIDKVRIGIGSDSRIGKRFLFAGIGFGGSCFPKDVQALIRSGRQAGYDFQIIQSVLEVNERQKVSLIPRVEAYLGGLSGKKIALWGLSFKPETDDIREAPSLLIIDQLLKRGARVAAYDPEAMDNVKSRLGQSIEYSDNQYDILKDAYALIIVTEWSTFRNPDFDKMARLMKNKAIFDGRNVYDLKLMEKLGFHYESIGRKTIDPSL